MNELYIEAFKAVRDIQDIFDKANNYEDFDKCIFDIDLVTNGSCIIIKFLDFQLWTSEEDMREFNENTNEYENLKDYLIKEIKQIFEDIKELEEFMK